MKIWKRNAVISTIVLFVCVALYLSWAYGRDNSALDPEVFDPNTNLEQNVGDANGEDTDTPIEAFNDYFTEMRLVRKQARDNAFSILSAASSTDDASQVVLDNVVTEIEKLANNAMSEASIEALVKAKGFEDCVAIISAEGIKIVVSAPLGGLTAVDVAKIKDIVLSECDVAVADINIVPVEA